MSQLEAPLAIRLPRGHRDTYHDRLKKIASDKGISVNALIVGLMEAEFQKCLLDESSSAQKITP